MIGKNNLVNIRAVPSSRWHGQLSTTRGFVDFISVEMCFRAWFIIIFRSYYNRGKRCLWDIIGTWAPPFENDTVSYYSFIIKDFRLAHASVDLALFKVEEVFVLFKAMVTFEVGRDYTKTFSSEDIARWIRRNGLNDVFRKSYGHSLL